MADTNATRPESAQTAPPRAPRGDNVRGGRGGRRGRGGRANNEAEGTTDNSQNEGRAPRRGRGGNRGAGSRGGNSTLTPADLATRFAQKATVAETPAALVPRTLEAKDDEEEDVDAEVCFICASPVVHNAVAPCNHRTCHICALRMRALYKTKDCAHCRTEAPYVIFTDDATKRFEDYAERDFASTDHNIGIKYQTQEVMGDSLILLHYNCPEPTCDIACRAWPELHRHVKGTHHKKMCDLCTRHKKVFTHEHDLFTDKELQLHMSKGDDNPGAKDQSGFKGHPLCSFCGQRFYGDDELYVHCRQKHERCFLCDRADSRNPHYYVNYESLEAHFKKDHYMCMERECQEKKFIVFSSEMDLKAHQLEDHANTLSKDVRRDARVVDLSSFDYRAPYYQERRGGESQREARNRGRGRDPNAEPIPASSAQPLRRDEQAFQRQMAIQSAQSVTTRTFGGQLTAPTPAQSAAATSGRNTGATNSSRQSAQSRATPAAQPQAPAVAEADLSPQEQARRQHHMAVISKATQLLNNDNLKINQFRNALSSYRSNTISASALIDTFFALFSDTSSSALGTLIRDVADLYEDVKKAEGIRTAWNDWRAINEDYPSLPGPSGMTGSASVGWAGVTASMPPNVTIAPAKSSRVLKLKSSTQQSSRSSQSRNGTWTNTATPSSSGAESAFPTLPPSSSSVQPTPRVTTVPWKPSSGNASSSQSTPRATPPTSRPASRVAGGRGGATGGDFPSLPPAPKPVSTIFGYGRGMVRRDTGQGSGPGASAWGASQAEEVQQQEEQGGKKKGNKGKKQVLVAWG
ncbi:hypothetical protein V502_05979 [Pseudogymnoascus sp. VKM F-4520 (FW-2644)]|nr:hypothetical protein V502_05979 [Pseudogymnoascus sp. VKM F-4520 (FW-2644)]